MPYIGADLFWLSTNADYNETDEDVYVKNGVTFREIHNLTMDYEGNAFLIVPNIGLKCFLNTELARPYVFGNVFIALPSVKLEGDNFCETRYYEDGILVGYEREKAKNIQTEMIQESITDILSFWGFTFGGGAEYFFNPHFSVGAEYGFRVVFDKADYTHFDSNVDSSDLTQALTHDWQLEVSASLKV